MTVQTLKIAGREFVLISKRDFAHLEALAKRHMAQARQDAGDAAESRKRMKDRGGVTLAQLRQQRGR